MEHTLVTLNSTIIDGQVYVEVPYTSQSDRMKELVPLNVYHAKKSKKIQKLKAA